MAWDWARRVCKICRRTRKRRRKGRRVRKRGNGERVRYYWRWTEGEIRDIKAPDKEGL